METQEPKPSAAGADDVISQYEREMARKRKNLDDRLDALSEDCNPEDRNDTIADNDVLEELGAFSDETANYFANPNRPLLELKNIPGREWTEEREKGIVTRTRLDALKAKLNTRSILTELRITNERLNQVHSRVKAIEIMVAITMVFAGLVFMKVFFGTNWP